MSSSRLSLARREPALPPVQGNGRRSAHPRDARRAELEARISQQRLDVSHALRELKEATAPIDRGWAKVQQYRGPLVLVGGLIAGRVPAKEGPEPAQARADELGDDSPSENIVRQMITALQRKPRHLGVR
mgnify:CR=1 FL=1